VRGRRSGCQRRWPMSSFPTWLFGLLALGRCGMSPRIC